MALSRPDQRRVLRLELIHVHLKETDSIPCSQQTDSGVLAHVMCSSSVSSSCDLWMVTCDLR